jgi:hypothetical protein
MEISWTGVGTAALLTVFLGLLFTHSVELREGRVKRILYTLPFACWIGNALVLPNAVVRGIYTFFWLFWIVFLWRDVFAHFLADFLVQGVMGFSKGARGVQMDLQYVKSARRFGEFERALKLLGEELEKEPYSYEALLLQASLNTELKRWKAAGASLEQLLEKSQLTNEQREYVKLEKKRLEEAVLVEQLNAR